MYLARIKISWGENNRNDYYEYDKWYDLFEYNDKICRWRMKSNGIFEFAIGIYENRVEALEDGKMLYFNILYELHRNYYGFKLGDDRYITNVFCKDRGYTLSEFKKNEEWFFSTKEYRANFLGLGIFEIDNDFEDYDKYYSLSGAISIQCINNEPFNFLKSITNLNHNYKYSKKSQEIFNLVRLSEQADEKTKILLLCEALERMGEYKDREKEEIEVLEKCINFIEESSLTTNQKEPLKNMLRQSKKISSKNKCKILIEKYSLCEYKQFNKMEIFNEVYKLRGKIIHGEELEDDTDYSCGYYLKIIVLDVLKEWTKENEIKQEV